MAIRQPINAVAFNEEIWTVRVLGSGPRHGFSKAIKCRDIDQRKTDRELLRVTEPRHCSSKAFLSRDIQQRKTDRTVFELFSFKGRDIALFNAVALSSWLCTEVIFHSFSPFNALISIFHHHGLFLHPFPQ